MRIFINTFFMVMLTLSIGQLAYAQITPPGQNGDQTPFGQAGDVTPAGQAQSFSIPNPLNASSITELFQTLLDVVMVFAIPIIVFFIIYAGFLYVTARGNEHTIEQAHRALLYALIGGMLILGARVLIDVVSGTVDSVINS